MIAVNIENISVQEIHHNVEIVSLSNYRLSMPGDMGKFDN